MSILDKAKTAAPAAHATTRRPSGALLVPARPSPLAVCPSASSSSPRRPAMPTYISLIKYTHQGISTIKEGPARLDANKVVLNPLRLGAEGVLPHHGPVRHRHDQRGTRRRRCREARPHGRQRRGRWSRSAPPLPV